MHAWRKLIGKQGAVRKNEELEAEHTDIIECVQKLFGGRACSFGSFLRDGSRNG
ncbi:hypothetical protein D3C72_2556620 [compost metagenome]